MIPAALVERIPPRIRVAKRALLSWRSGEPELRLAPRLCSRGELALDIGANLGVYTWHLARRAAAVVAFEPQPELARFLRRAFGERVRVEEVALSDEAGEAVLRIPRDRMASGRATIEAANALSAFDTAEIRVAKRRLDDFGLGSVGLIKIDVEGHERAVIDGARALLARDKPSLIVEAEDRHHPDALREVRERLADLGYRGFVWRDGALRPLGPRAGAVDGSAGNFVFIARPNLLASAA